MREEADYPMFIALESAGETSVDGCHAALALLIREEDGKAFIREQSFDGRTGTHMHPGDRVMCFFVLCGTIAKSEEIAPQLRAIAKAALDSISEEMMKQGVGTLSLTSRSVCKQCGRTFPVETPHACGESVQ